jgi:hypothetical protein
VLPVSDPLERSAPQTSNSARGVGAEVKYPQRSRSNQASGRKTAYIKPGGNGRQPSTKNSRRQLDFIADQLVRAAKQDLNIDHNCIDHKGVPQNVIDAHSLLDTLERHKCKNNVHFDDSQNLTAVGLSVVQTCLIFIDATYDLTTPSWIVVASVHRLINKEKELSADKWRRSPVCKATWTLRCLWLNRESYEKVHGAGSFRMFPPKDKKSHAERVVGNRYAALEEEEVEEQKDKETLDKGIAELSKPESASSTPNTELSHSEESPSTVAPTVPRNESKDEIPERPVPRIPHPSTLPPDETGTSALMTKLRSMSSLPKSGYRVDEEEIRYDTSSRDGLGRESVYESADSNETFHLIPVSNLKASGTVNAVSTVSALPTSGGKILGVPSTVTLSSGDDSVASAPASAPSNHITIDSDSGPVYALNQDLQTVNVGQWDTARKCIITNETLWTFLTNKRPDFLSEHPTGYTFVETLEEDIEIPSVFLTEANGFWSRTEHSADNLKVFRLWVSNYLKLLREPPGPRMIALQNYGANIAFNSYKKTHRTTVEEENNRSVKTHITATLGRIQVLLKLCAYIRIITRVRKLPVAAVSKSSSPIQVWADYFGNMAKSSVYGLLSLARGSAVSCWSSNLKTIVSNPMETVVSPIAEEKFRTKTTTFLMILVEVLWKRTLVTAPIHVALQVIKDHLHRLHPKLGGETNLVVRVALHSMVNVFQLQGGRPTASLIGLFSLLNKMEIFWSAAQQMVSIIADRERGMLEEAFGTPVYHSPSQLIPNTVGSTLAMFTTGPAWQALSPRAIYHLIRTNYMACIYAPITEEIGRCPVSTAFMCMFESYRNNSLSTVPLHVSNELIRQSNVFGSANTSVRVGTHVLWNLNAVINQNFPSTPVAKTVSVLGWVPAAVAAGYLLFKWWYNPVRIRPLVTLEFPLTDAKPAVYKSRADGKYSLKDTKLKLVQLRRVQKVFGFYSQYYKPVAYASNLHNEVEAVKARVLKETPRPNKSEIVTFWHWLKHNYKSVFPHTCKTKWVPMSIEQYLIQSNATPTVKDSIKRARDGLEAEGIDEYSSLPRDQLRKYTSRKAFVKVENNVYASPAGVKDKAPRLIQGGQPEFIALTGPSIATLQKHIKRDLNKNNFCCFTSGVSTLDVALLATKFSTWLENDVGAWDASMCELLLTIEYWLFCKLGCPPLVQKLMFHNINTRGCTAHGCVYSRKGCRKSGDPWTSLGNSIMNILIHLYIFCTQNHVTVSQARNMMTLVVQGDDALLNSEHQFVRHIDWKNAFLNFGFDAVALFRQNVYQVEFCSMRIYPSLQGFVFGPKPGKVMAKLGIFCDPPAKCDPRVLIRGSALSLIRGCWHIPPLRSYLQRILDLTEDVSAHPTRREDWQMRFEPCEEHPDVWYALETTHQWSREMQEGLDRELSSVNLQSCTVGPFFDVLCDRDSSAPKVFPW